MICNSCGLKVTMVTSMHFGSAHACTCPGFRDLLSSPLSCCRQYLQRASSPYHSNHEPVLAHSLALSPLGTLTLRPLPLLPTTAMWWGCLITQGRECRARAWTAKAHARAPPS